MKKLLTGLLATTLLLASSGCAKGETKTPETTQNGIETIYDFESWDELATCAFKYQFGKATINKDKAYIKSGEGSMKVEIAATTQAPYILFYPGFDPVNKSDFNDVDRITMDVYNPEDREISIWLGLDVRASYGFEINTTGKEFILRPNAWNKIVYQIDREAFLRAFSLDEVMHIALRFDTIGEEGAYTLYVDKMQIRTGESLKTYNVSREADEILYFEHDTDLNFFNCSTYYFVNYLYPLLSVNLDPQYCSQGKKSMYVRVPVSDLTVFPMVELQVDAVGQEVFKDATAFSVDIYNANHKRLPVDIHVRDFNRTSGGAPKAALKRQVWLEPNTWTTVVFTRDELNTATVDMDKLENIGFELLDQSDSAFGKYVDFYFDNFKVIK